MEEPEIAAPSAPAARAQTQDPRASFNIKAMDTHRVVHAVFNWLCDYPQREYLMRFFRRFWPILRIPFARLVIVFRDEDVREVLAHHEEFPVPWGSKMIALSGKKNFVLGMKEGPDTGATASSSRKRSGEKTCPSMSCLSPPRLRRTFCAAS